MKKEKVNQCQVQDGNVSAVTPQTVIGNTKTIYAVTMKPEIARKRSEFLKGVFITQRMERLGSDNWTLVSRKNFIEQIRRFA